MDQARSPLGTQHHQPPPPPSLESENETVDVESVSADVSSVSVDQSPLPMALPSHLDIEDDKQMDSTVLRQIMNIVISLQPNQGAICDRHKSLSGCYVNQAFFDRLQKTQGRKNSRLKKSQGHFSAKNLTFRRFLRLQPKKLKRKILHRKIFIWVDAQNVIFMDIL